MYKLFILALFFIFGSACQDFGRLKIQASLPPSMNEISGMEYASKDGMLWCVNDSGNEPELYLYNTKKNTIIRTIVISNGENKDWEDLAVDENGTVFIGDFGNNNNKRKDLIIYSVTNALDRTEMALKANKTTFRLEDQTKFPPKKKERNFDIEAFVFYQDSFYLFTRNRSSGFDGITKMYRLPAKDGDFEAELVGSFKTCDDSRDCMITSASFDFRNKKLVLLSYTKIWIFSDFEGDDFFNGKVEKINLGHRSQKESICWYNSNMLYISDEAGGLSGANLYSLIID